ncbi:MAG: hypothetical protein AB8B72_08210 [Crocinitomicaceae bacterium]
MLSKESLKTRFEKYGAAPKADAWAGISAALPAKSKKKAAIWWLFAGSGIAACVLLSFFALRKDGVEIDRFSNIKELSVDNQNSKEISDAQANFPNHNIEENIASEQTKASSTKLNNYHIDNSEISESVVANNSISAINRRKSERSKLFQSEISVVPIVQPVTVEINKESEKTKTDIPCLSDEIKFMNLQEIPLLALTKIEVLPQRKETIKNKIGSWQWGAEISSNYSIYNEQISGFTAESFSDNSIILVESSEYQDYLNELPYFFEINRPLKVAFILQYTIKSRFFTQLDPTFTILSGKPSVMSLVGSPTSTKFFAVGIDAKFGYKIFDKVRWSFDVAAGFHYERLFSKEPYITKGTALNLIGSIGEIGFSYKLSEKTALRFAPEFNRIHGNSKDRFDFRLKRQSNLGFSFSFLQEF